MRSEFAAQSPVVSETFETGQGVENVVEMPRHPTEAERISAEKTLHLSALLTSALALARMEGFTPKDPELRDLWVSTVLAHDDKKLPVGAMDKTLDLICGLTGMQKPIIQGELLRAMQDERSKHRKKPASAVKAP